MTQESTLAIGLQTLLVAHIVFAAGGLLAGAVALILPKGQRRHRWAGGVFVGSMLVMAFTAGLLSFTAGRTLDVFSSFLTCYLVTTALLAFKPAPVRVRVSLMVLGCACFAGYVGIETTAMTGGVRSTDAPAGAGFVFAGVLAIALFGDVRALRADLSRQQTLLRHLWRMNFALLIATASFFGARPHLFPQWMQSSGALTVLTFLPLILIVYWTFRVRTRAGAHRCPQGVHT